MARFYMVVAVAARMKPRGSKRISCDQMMLMGISIENRSLKNKPLVANRHVDMPIKSPSSGLTSLAGPSRRFRGCVALRALSHDR
jgi:hypothetical protein